MSKNIPTFRVTIVGDSARDVRANMREYLGLDKEPGPENPEEQEDFLTQAAEEGPPWAPPVKMSRADASPIDLAPPIAAVPLPFVPPPVASASTTSTTSVNTVAGVDSKGLPWDGRIHASSRALTKDGAWRYKRGVEDSQIRSVEYELIAKIKNDVPVTLPPVQTMSTPSFPSTPPNGPQIPPVPVAPPPMPAPEPTLPHAHTADTFKKNLIPVLAKLVRDGKLTHDYVNTLKAHFGVDEIHKVSEAQAEEMFNMFVQYGMIAKV